MILPSATVTQQIFPAPDFNVETEQVNSQSVVFERQLRHVLNPSSYTNHKQSPMVSGSTESILWKPQKR